MTPCSRKNPLCSAGPSNPSKHGTPALSDAGSLDALVPDARVPTPAPAKYTKKDFQSMTKPYIEFFLQAQAGCPKSHRKGQLKAKFPDLYYGKFYMECYHFCQQCEYHFAIAGTTGASRTPFAASFLCDRISFHWHQHKIWKNAAGACLPWNEFKAFFQKSLGNSKSFVDTIWNKIKRDSQYQQKEVQDWASYLEHL